MAPVRAPAPAPAKSVAAARDQLLATFQWAGEHADLWRVFADPAFPQLIAGLAAPFTDSGVTAVAGIQSRGFLLGGAVAAHLGVGFIAIRKAGDLFCGPSISHTTQPDYQNRQHTLLLRTDALDQHDRVLLVDDWLETGNQAAAATAMIHQTGATLISHAVLIDQLSDLDPAAAAALGPIHSLVRYHELPIPDCCAGDAHA